MAVLACVYQFSYGLGSAASVRVSNTLGAGDHQGAATAAAAALIMVVRPPSPCQLIIMDYTPAEHSPVPPYICRKLSGRYD
jgi:hypothetical protein